MKRPVTAALFAGVAILAAGSVAGQPAASQDNPRFRVGVDLVPVDVTVVDQQGHPVPDLGPQDFKVFIDGAARRVVSAEWISLTGNPSRPDAPERRRVEGYTSNDQATGGRLIVLAIDQPNIRFGGGRALVGTIERFLDHLSSGDRIALVGLGRGTQSIPFTADRDLIKQAVARMNGQMEPPAKNAMFNIRLTLPAALAITRGDPVMIDRFVQNCSLFGGDSNPFSSTRNGRDTCEKEITREAAEAVDAAKEHRDATIRALTDLMSSLSAIDAPKSLVLISEGFPLFDEDNDTSSRLTSLGSLAATARTSIYALRLDDRIFNASSAGLPISPDADVQIRANGLETLTAAARGALFTVTNTGQAAFDRIESELSGYYLLGVEFGSELQKAKPSKLRVEVARKGVVTRARTTIATLVADREASDRASTRSGLAAAAAALTTPLTLSALPLRVISFNFQGPDPSKIQLLIHADIGEGYRAPQSVSVAYMITDAKGQVVASEAVTEQVTPAAAGQPSPLAFAAGTALPPGDYLLKLAAAEGNKVGSVEAPIHVSLVEAGALKLSDLTVGGPVPAGGEPTRPTVDYTVRFGLVHGFLEAYGAGSAAATVRYEIARDEQSPALLAEVVPARRVNESRALFSRRISVAALPPGRYYLRASIAVADAVQKTMSRAFEISAPAALAATANTSRTDVVTDSGTELFLPVESGDIAVPFQTADALRPETLAPFLARLPAAARPGFDAGVDYLRKRDYTAAEASFKRAIVPNLDFTAAVAYLAVTFAASGHHAEAASAWQTALVGGSDLPQIYWWLGHALLRTHDFLRARSTLEEAVRRWPADTRFARPLAVLNATTGRTYKAVQQLQRYLAANHGDVDALYLGVQWIYHIHLNGGVVSDGAADLKLAQMYADEYKRANGPKLLLVTQWLDYLAKSQK
jgi:VWFA-related protein